MRKKIVSEMQVTGYGNHPVTIEIERSRSSGSTQTYTEMRVAQRDSEGEKMIYLAMSQDERDELIEMLEETKVFDE